MGFGIFAGCLQHMKTISWLWLCPRELRLNPRESSSAKPFQVNPRNNKSLVSRTQSAVWKVSGCMISEIVGTVNMHAAVHLSQQFILNSLCLK